MELFLIYIYAYMLSSLPTLFFLHYMISSLDNYWRTPRVFLFGYDETGSPMPPEKVLLPTISIFYTVVHLHCVY